MRLFSALFLVVALAVAGQAQTTPSPEQAPPAAAPPRVGVETDAREVREHFEQLLRKYPPELGRILKMDPTMLANQQYLAQYPALQQFLATHPEIIRNPSFYLQFVQLSTDYTRPTDARSQAIAVWGDVLQGISVFFILILVSAVLGWLVKTVLHHRQWVRTSKVQTEVHNKLLDRFAGTNELMAYVQSPAGRRFLEAAPIPVEPDAERPASTPLSRIMWSVQVGIVLLVGGIGFQFVSGRVIDEVAQGLWTIGVLASAFGLGFIAAGAFSLVMSRRLGLLEVTSPTRSSQHGDSPAV